MSFGDYKVSSAGLHASPGGFCWLEFSGEQDGRLCARKRSELNVSRRRLREIAPEVQGVLHSMFSHFLNNRVSHLSTSNSSSGKEYGVWNRLTYGLILTFNLSRNNVVKRPRRIYA